MECGPMKCPYTSECINQIYARPKPQDSSDKMAEDFPPPPPPQVDGTWELQFCKWWGWTWVRKENQAETVPAKTTATPSTKSVSIAAPMDAEKSDSPPPREKRKKGCFGCRKKKKPPPAASAAASKSVEKHEAGFNTSKVSIKKSECFEEAECCLCCPCMQQQFMPCPCMQQPQQPQNQFFNQQQFQQNIQEIPLSSKQVQCSQHCTSVDTQTQQKLQQMGCPCVLQRYQQQFTCCPCQQNRIFNNFPNNKQLTNNDTQTGGKVVNQSTAISHVNIPKAKKYRECKCIRKFMRPNCCPCNTRQMTTCCPCYNISECPQKQNYTPTKTVTTNWCLTDPPSILTKEFKSFNLKQSPPLIDKSIDLLIKNNMNIKNLLDTEKFFRSDRVEEFDSNETITFLSNNVDSKDHCKLLTKVCDAILSSNTFNERISRNKSSSSSSAHLPTILSDRSLYETIRKDTKNQYLQKLMDRSEKETNFNGLMSKNNESVCLEKEKEIPPIRSNISRMSFTNPNLARAETIEELITAMDLSFNNNVLENFETTSSLNKEK